MGPQPPPKSSTIKPPHKKTPRLSSNQKIQKRPLLHPPIAAPRTGSSTQKIIYISASSPFISTIKRVRSYLSHIESRSAGAISLSNSNSHKLLQKAIEAGIKKARDGKGEEVIVKATGKAIEKALRVALHFEGEEDVSVRLGTGSVGAVDDIVEGEAEVGSRVRRVSCLEVGVRLT